MSLPAAPIPVRFWFVLAACVLFVAALVWRRW